MNNVTSTIVRTPKWVYINCRRRLRRYYNYLSLKKIILIILSSKKTLELSKHNFR